ncbi:hypothetical protein B0H13DRAFT_2338112 [Mycena leptocephala]|nr:hypothetical protein B0H13DRAFT_2338112 [Mycena leptocephala]
MAAANHMALFSADFSTAATHLANLVAANAAMAQPPWALNMQNQLLNIQNILAQMQQTAAWDNHITQIKLHNQDITAFENTEWTIARVANSTRKERSHRLVRLIQPLPRLLITAVPAAPAAGAPPNLPAPFVPLPIVAPGHHPLFPTTKRGLERLNMINLATLLAAYNQPVPATKPLRQAALAQFIGLPL